MESFKLCNQITVDCTVYSTITPNNIASNIQMAIWHKTRSGHFFVMKRRKLHKIRRVLRFREQIHQKGYRTTTYKCSLYNKTI